MAAKEASDESVEARFEGFGLGLGLAAAGVLCWFLPGLLDVGGGWGVAGRVAAAVLFIVGSAGSLVELEKERSGFGELAVTAVCAGVGIGLLALATQVLHSFWAGASAVVGVLLIVLALGAAGMGLGKMASSEPRTRAPAAASTAPVPTNSARTRFSRAEKWALILAALQVVLAAVALLADG